jgi:multicomponent K+:H+ antiporter subunit F
MSQLLTVSLWVAMLAVGVSLLLCGWRLYRGPSAVDRVLAMDTLYINGVAFIVLLGIVQQSRMLFEAALLVAMLGFVSTVAMARYISRGDVME